MNTHLILKRYFLFLFLFASLTSSYAITEEYWSDKRVGIIIERDSRNNVVVYVKNNEYSEILLELNMKITNMKCNKKLPLLVTVPAKAKKMKICWLLPKNPSRRASYAPKWRWIHGNPSARHDKNYTYTLPYPPDKKYIVSQGYNGKFSHHGANANSIDWAIPIGAKIHAARGGVVVDLQEKYTLGGRSRNLKLKANYILIRHTDATLGVYRHLKYRGVLVKKGQRVRKGQLIALSGNTGYSSGPHLHFGVYKPISLTKTTNYKMKFSTSNGTGIYLQEGLAYRPRPQAITTHPKPTHRGRGG